MADEQPQPKKRRARSPSYPGISLELAIQRAQRVYDMDGRNFAPVDAIVDHWGYTKGSGPGLVTLAALKKYGLLEFRGSGESRQARLTDLALGILLDEPSSPARQAAIKEAALNPPINRDLWDSYNGHLPSDQSLRLHLVRDLKFTETGALEFIEVFKETIAFAGLDEDASMSQDGTDKKQTEDSLVRPASTIVPSKKGDVASQTVAVTIPVPRGAWPVLSAPLPMSDEDWRAMLAYLELMRPAFVRAPRQEPEPEQDQD